MGGVRVVRRSKIWASFRRSFVPEMQSGDPMKPQSRGRVIVLYMFLFLKAFLLLFGISYGATLNVSWFDADVGDLSLVESIADFSGIKLKFKDDGEIFDLEGGEGKIAYVFNGEYISRQGEEWQRRLFAELSRDEIIVMIVLDRESIYDFDSLGEEIAVYSNEPGRGVLNFSRKEREILMELSGTELPIELDRKGLFIEVNSDREREGTEPRTLVSIVDFSGATHESMLVQRFGKGVLFLATVNHYELEDPYYKEVPAVLPFLVFMRNAFGEKLWHRKRNQATFVIDDPWLIEPYGNLSYHRLLQEMETVNFHTSIAFIPWNYDRSRPEAVKIFRNNPDRYSIVIHGNNHNGYEFRRYEEVPLLHQEKDIRQALGRMEKFRDLTGIAYDRIMIFPHGISPKMTLGILKKYNFSASANAQLTPLGSEIPEDVKYILPPAVLKYNNFPLLRRYSPYVKKGLIDIDLFLKKPLIFYTHQDYFSKGINAFNEIAEYVNHRSMGEMDWTSLGSLADNLYMERLGDDGAYHIKMMSRSIRIHNYTKHRKTYYIDEVSIGLEDIEKLIIGSNEYTEDIESMLRNEISIGPGESVQVEIMYENSLDFAEVPVRKSKLRIWIRRILSDFRDLVISRSGLRKLVNLSFAY